MKRVCVYIERERHSGSFFDAIGIFIGSRGKSHAVDGCLTCAIGRGAACPLVYLRRSIRGVLLLASAKEEEERFARQRSQGQLRSFNSNNQLLVLIEYTVVDSGNANLHLIDRLAGLGVVQRLSGNGCCRRRRRRRRANSVFHAHEGELMSRKRLVRMHHYLGKIGQRR